MKRKVGIGSRKAWLLGVLTEIRSLKSSNDNSNHSNNDNNHSNNNCSPFPFFFHLVC